MGRYIVIKNGIIVSERIGPSIVPGEIESNTGKVGDMRQQDGTFITPEPELITEEAKETQLDRIEKKLDQLLSKFEK